MALKHSFFSHPKFLWQRLWRMGTGKKAAPARSVEHSPLSRDGVGIGGRFCICIYRPSSETRWSCVVFDGDRLIDVKANAFATDIQALLSANLQLAAAGQLVDDRGD